MELKALCAAVFAGTMVLAGCGESGTGPEESAAPGDTSGQDGDLFGQDGKDPAAQGLGCEHVDVVFALDNSSSMSEEKSSMRNDVFPAFAEALLDIDGIQDFRAGVLDACPTPANFHTRGAGGECSFESGAPWMESSSGDVVSEFQCVADLFSGDAQCSGDNDDEQPASAAAAALEPPYSDGANAGFVRPDALLVVVAITDEDEQPVPAQDMQALHDRLVAAKGGNRRNVVFLGIGGESACDGVYGSAEEATALQSLTGLFAADGRGVFWDLCAGHLEDGLTEALATIEGACGEFVPEPVH